MTPPTAMIALFLSGGSPFFLDCVLNLADVRDIADGIVKAGERGRAGERYILGGENCAMRDLLPELEQQIGTPHAAPLRPRGRWRLATGFVAGFVADKVTRTPPIATQRSRADRASLGAFRQHEGAAASSATSRARSIRP